MKNRTREMLTELGIVKSGELFIITSVQKICFFTFVDGYKFYSKPYNPNDKISIFRDDFDSDPDLLISLLSGDFEADDIKSLKEKI